mgnify:FL=1
MTTATQAEYTVRELVDRTAGIPASDGAGVELTRIIGSPELNVLDPFLLLDSFESDQPQDYIGGFPDHPHRGFETVTYLLAGRMRHKDNAGHEGVIEPNGVQWMTAGRGIVHSEMPEQENGLLMGFQLWVNLPATHKMTEPGYQEYPEEQLPVEQRSNGTRIRVIAGQTDAGTVGPVENPHVRPIYMDVTLPADESFAQALPGDDNAFVYVISGELLVGEAGEMLPARTLGILGSGERTIFRATGDDVRFLLVSGKPLNEPVARGGPFVMNTQQEVLQAFEDFRHNRF